MFIPVPGEEPRQIRNHPHPHPIKPAVQSSTELTVVRRSGWIQWGLTGNTLWGPRSTGWDLGPWSLCNLGGCGVWTQSLFDTVSIYSCFYLKHSQWEDGQAVWLGRRSTDIRSWGPGGSWSPPGFRKPQLCRAAVSWCMQLGLAGRRSGQKKAQEC